MKNADNICQDPTGGTLSPKGINQAADLAKEISGLPIDYVFVSDAQRTVDTAQAILKYHPVVKLQTDTRLRERDCGNLRGHKFPHDWDWDKLPADCESNEQLVSKIKDFLTDIYPRHYNDTVLVVTHAHIIKAFLIVIEKLPVDQLNKFIDVDNTGLLVREINEL